MQHSRRNVELIESAGLFRDLLLSDRNGMFGEAVILFPELRTKRSKRYYFIVEHYATTHQFTDSNISSLINGNSPLCQHHELNGTIKYSRDDFLKLPILCTASNHYSFKDIVQFVSNKLGARHYDLMSGSEKQLLLHEIRNKYQIQGFDPILNHLIGKSGVIIHTGRELVSRITNFL